MKSESYKFGYNEAYIKAGLKHQSSLPLRPLDLVESEYQNGKADATLYMLRSVHEILSSIAEKTVLKNGL